MCLRKEQGRLGIQSLATLNKAFLGKRAWRFAVEDNPMWKKVITLKYQIEEGSWITKDPRGSFEVGLWNDISNAAKKLRHDCNFFLLGMVVELNYRMIRGARKDP